MTYMLELQSLCRKLNCKCLINEPLKNHTTFHIGGNCKAFISINSIGSLIEIKKFIITNKIKSLILGRGSNVIVSDEGFDGVVLKFGKEFSQIKLMNKNEIYCEAGTSLKDLCLFALDNSLSGLEFAYGIPGTVGGALFMNAGAYGGEMRDVILKADYLNENFEQKCMLAEEINLSYRHSIFADRNDYIITGIYFKLDISSSVEIKKRMDELLKRRKDKQPLEYPSAGSTFKRPEGSYASLLIEQCGLKGCSVGGAEVSQKHSGFVINKNNATCSDVIKLTEIIKDKVKMDTGYTLELEPQIIE